MAPRKKAQPPQFIYQLKITLRDIRPPIWRRVQVRSDNTLRDLHYTIQAAMGWGYCHLHSFTINGLEYGEPTPDFGMGEVMEDEKQYTLNQLISAEKFKFGYLYDFGDSWEHTILVEKILEPDPNLNYPRCITAKRACPPEDCGGPWGYPDFLEAIQDPKHPEHEDLLEWIGGSFDPEEVDLEQINHDLQNKSLRFEI